MRTVCGVLIAVSLFSHTLSAQEWKKHHDPAGFSLDLPAAWQVERGSNGFLTFASPDGESFTQVIPILNRQQPCPNLLVESFRAPSRRFPDARLMGVQPGRDKRSAVAQVSFRGGAAQAAVLCSETGPRSAMLYAIAAPRTAYAAQRPMLLKMLLSFQYGEAGAAAPRAAAPPVSFVRWTDPHEGAFSIQIPAGWQAEGGVIRRTNLEIGMGVRVTSPDHRTVLVFSDPRIQTAMTPIQGARVGSPAYGGGVFLPYVTGLVFAENYLRMFLLPEAGVQFKQVIEKRERPDLSAAGNQQNARFNANPAGPPRSTHGEIVFTATNREGQPVSGYLLGETTLNPSPAGMGHVWKGTVFGYLAPTEAIPQTMQILSRILASGELNSRWAQSTQQAGQQTQQAYHAASQQASEYIASSYWARQGSQENRAAAFSDRMRDQVRLNDGQGRQYVAPSGKNYYYADDQNGRIVGTNDASLPSVDLRQLEIVR